MARAFALSRGNELDSLLSKAKDHVLRALFGGGVIRGTKLQRGSVYTFEDVDLNSSVGVQMSHMIQCYENNAFIQKIFPVQGLIKQISQKGSNRASMRLNPKPLSMTTGTKSRQLISQLKFTNPQHPKSKRWENWHLEACPRSRSKRSRPFPSLDLNSAWKR